jgi:hypothetical protein
LSRRGIAAASAFLLVVGVLAVEWGAARGISDIATNAAQVRSSNPAVASSLYQIVAQQNVALTLLDRGDVVGATHLAQAAAADAAVSAAQTAVVQKDFARAVALLSEISSPLSSQAQAVQALAFIGEAQRLVASGFAPDALELVAALSPANPEARAMYPGALLAAAQVCSNARSYNEETSDLNTLINLFPDSTEADTARAMLLAPQDVVGTLTDRTGNPIVARVRLSSHFTALDSGSYQTTGPFYYGKTDASGNFRFNPIPVGGPYVLEVFRDGGWTTLIDPTTGKPADPVQVQPLTAADLAFIVLP